MVNPASLNNLSCLSSYLYIDTKNTWKQSTIKLFLVLAKYKNLETLINSMLKLAIFTYLTKDYIILLNNWDNLDYFTAMFFMFFFKTDSYLN